MSKFEPVRLRWEGLTQVRKQQCQSMDSELNFTLETIHS